MEEVYDNLCEMEITDLMKSVINPEAQSSCSLEKPIQPDDNIGEFGNTVDIHLKETEEGGLEIDTKYMAVKLSADIFDAIKSLIKKGE